MGFPVLKEASIGVSRKRIEVNLNNARFQFEWVLNVIAPRSLSRSVANDPRAVHRNFMMIELT